MAEVKEKERKEEFKKLVKASEKLRAISYPYRLEILKFLADEEYHPVYEIQAYLGIEATLLSHHLSKMKAKGILESYRDGRFIQYKLIEPMMLNLLDCINKCDL